MGRRERGLSKSVLMTMIITGTVIVNGCSMVLLLMALHSLLHWTRWL